MEIIKTVITTLDILLILLFFTFGKTAKDKPTAIGDFLNLDSDAEHQSEKSEHPV